MNRWKNMVQVRDVGLYLIPRCASTAMRDALLRGSGEDPDHTATRNPAFSRAHPEAAITGDTIRRSIRQQLATSRKRTLDGSVFDRSLLPYIEQQQYLQ